MIRLARGARLAFTLARLNASRTLGLMVMIAIGLLVFTATTSLARASDAELEAEIARTQGVPTLFSVTPPVLASAPTWELGHVATAAVSAELAATPSARVLGVEQINGLAVGCGYSWTLDPESGPTFVIVHDPDAKPLDVVEISRGDRCIQGTQFPAEALGVLPDALERVGAVAQTVHSGVARLARGAAKADGEFSVYVWSTEATTGLDSRAQQACTEAVAPFVNPGKPFGLTDIDAKTSTECAVNDLSPSAGLREAGENVGLVFNVLGWAVLALGALGLLIAENIIMRDRSWLFGLARGVGARPVDVAWLVVCDVVIVLVGGLALTAAGLVAAAPAVSQFALETFGQRIDILTTDVATALAAGALGVMVVATIPPVARAIATDPLDVIEDR